MQNYLDLLRDVRENGKFKEDRTGTGTYSIFGPQLSWDLSKGFPLVTTKKIHIKSLVHELLWFIKGDTSVKYLQENGVRIWNEWLDEENTVGRLYPHQWTRVVGRETVGIDDTSRIQELLERGYKLEHQSEYLATYYKTFNQLAKAIRLIKEDPKSRRIIVDSWNVTDLADMQLTPCHCFYQFYVNDGKLSIMFVQR